jgi:hypothetical protein
LCPGHYIGSRHHLGAGYHECPGDDQRSSPSDGRARSRSGADRGCTASGSRTG